MPGDTTYIIPGLQGDPLFLPRKEMVQEKPLGPLYRLRLEAQVPVPDKFTEQAINVFFCLLISVIFLALIVPPVYRRIKVLLNARRAREVYADRQPDYHPLLEQYLPYYRRLDTARQQLFLRRTVHFMTAKQFEYVALEPEERMPLLISATAVQLTFGLEHYLLEHFEKIYVLHHDYHYGLNSVPFQGHVAHDGIYLSWSNFLRGYDNYQDGDNVGLHEMAHALAYVNFNVNEGRDDGFHYRFIRFSQTGRVIFNDMQFDLSGGFLGRYAATRYEEFWAVCVENFFERPTSFKIQLPELYAAMCVLLNQDPLSPGIVLDPVKNG